MLNIWRVQNLTEHSVHLKRREKRDFCAYIYQDFLIGKRKDSEAWWARLK